MFGASKLNKCKSSFIHIYVTEAKYRIVAVVVEYINTMKTTFDLRRWPALTSV